MTATFYLGTQAIMWLRTLDVPLFVSRRRLFKVKRLHAAQTRWALDSGGFTELRDHGCWTISPLDYVREVRRYHDEIGMLDWAAPQDHMCEPSIREATGLDVEEHQRLTVANLLDLRWLDDGLPFMPVLQGWERDDYLRHVDMYAAAGVDLTAEPVVGVGSICRRHADVEISRIVRTLADLGLQLHAFGVRGPAFRRLSNVLRSADSMSWTYDAWKSGPLPTCTHRVCSWCPEYALRWRARLLDRIQPELFDACSTPGDGIRSPTCVLS